MCDFSCDVCAPPLGCGTVKYEFWVEHLISDVHQAELKKRSQLQPTKRWRDEDDSFVLTRITNGLPFPWSLAELAEWLSLYGVLTEFMYSPQYSFCIFTLQGFGLSGKERARSIAYEGEFHGHQIKIRPKSTYGKIEWNIIYSSVDNYRPVNDLHQRQPGFTVKSEDKLARANNSVQVPAASTSFSVPKGTRVFTNKNNQSSNNNNYRQQTPISANLSISAKSAKESTSSSSLSSEITPTSRTNNSTTITTTTDQTTLGVDKGSTAVDRKRNKRRKSKEKMKVNETRQDQHGETRHGETRHVPTSSSSTSKISVPLVPHHDRGVKNEEFPPLTRSNAQTPQQEPLNFRGGFTPSGRRDREYRMSESSDCGQHVDLQLQQPHNQKGVASALSEVQALQRTVTNDKSSSHDAFKDHKHAQNGNVTSNLPRQNVASRNPQGHDNSTPLHHSARQYQQHQPQQILISPIFASQMAPTIASSLSNPMIPKARNPYKFENLPPFPYFFDLFNNLPEESFKPQKDILFKQFYKLPLANQLEDFILAQSLTHDEMRLRWQVILDILFLLRQHYPRCELYAFGSILTGLGDFKSDIDIYVDLAGEYTSSNPVNPAHKMSGHEAVDTVKKIIRRSLCPHTKNRFVQNLIPVKSARVPILKLTHQITRINCDLSFENRLSVQNTKLLSFYLKLDVRIFRFMVLIRYWAKFHHLTGSNHIKNYALTLLVLVYMTRKGYLPSIDFIQKLKAEERKQKKILKNPDEIDGWDASFCDAVFVIKQNFEAVHLPSSASPDNKNNSNNNYASHTQTLIQMATEFFEMFANLDFSQVVVCPLVGDVLPKEKFCAGNEESLPDALDRYKNWAVKQPMNRRLNVRTHLCVQDPFVLSFNVGSVTPQGTLLKFQIACAKSAQILSQKNGLKSLLDVLVPLPAHIGEKKFMRAYKTERLAQDLKKEIKGAVVMIVAAGAAATSEETLQPKLSQRSSYVTLPAHLRSFDKLIDEKGLKQESKRPRWENFLDLNLTSQFEALFVAELTRLKYAQTSSRPILMDKLRTLWQQFTLDFVRDFFETGMKLTVLHNKEAVAEPYDADANCIEVVKGEDGGGRRQRWRMNFFNKRDEDTVMARGPKSAEDIENIGKKIQELPRAPDVISYKVVSYRVAYPFWEKRHTLLTKIAGKIKASEMVQIPLLTTAKTIKNKETKERHKGKRSKDSKHGKPDEGTAEFDNCFDPISLEAKVSEIIAESWKENGEVNDFTEFQFSILLKVDVSAADERPELFLIFEKDLSTSCNSTSYSRAFQCLADILLDAFPRYLIYRLAKWFELPSPAVVSLPNLLNEIGGSTSTTATVEDDDSVKKKQEIVSNEEDGQATAGEQNKENKKRTRTKLEEDLLIPSSSSSTFSDEGDNNGVEELSEDDIEIRQSGDNGENSGVEENS